MKNIIGAFTTVIVLVLSIFICSQLVLARLVLWHVGYA